MTVDAFQRAWTIASATGRDGVTRTRLVAHLPIHVTCTNPDSLPGLRVDLDPGDELELGGVRGSDRIVLERDAGGVRFAAVHVDAADIFHAVAPDVTDHVLTASNGRHAAQLLVQRFAHWQRVFRRTASGILTPRRQLGLLGELLTLRDLVIPAIGPVAAVPAWTGPAGTPQDFQASGVGIEVKTIVHSEPQNLVIDGERQLDSTGLAALIVAHHRVHRHRGSGLTLPDLVAEVEAAVGDHPATQQLLVDGLVNTGYHDEDSDEYRAHGYTVTQTRYYHVVEGFPRLTESDLPDGLGGLRYSIDASACVPFETGGSDVLNWLTDPSRIPGR